MDVQADAPKAMPKIVPFSNKFADYDKNGDGKVTREEFGQATNMAAGEVAQIFRSLEANGGESNGRRYIIHQQIVSKLKY